MFPETRERLGSARLTEILETLEAPHSSIFPGAWAP
jgi:hypothetical protein